MEPTMNETSETMVAAPASFIHRMKPRASARVQLALAASMWFVASLILGIRGTIWLAQTDSWLLLFGLAAGVGVLKARFLLDRVARKAAARIHERGRSECAGGFLSWQSWALVAAMIAGGHALRLTATPRPVLGVLYVAVGVALLVAGRIYWSEAIRAA